MPAVLEFENVSKRYQTWFAKEERWALRDFSLQVEPGEIVGFLGPNGAGKTTALNIAIGLIHPTSGGGTILGQPFGAAFVRRRIGFLAESPAFHQQKACDVLKFCGALNGMREPQLSLRTNELLGVVGLREEADRNVGKFSRGMLQRVGVAQAFINDPDLLVLDEPTSALDPISRMQIRQALLKSRERGKSVFLSSHQLSEVELICDRVVFLNNGQVIAEGRTHELLEDKNECEIIAEGLASAPAIAKNTSRDGTRWRFTVASSEQRRTLETIWASGGTLISVTPKNRTLEELFLKFVSRSDRR